MSNQIYSNKTTKYIAKRKHSLNLQVIATGAYRFIVWDIQNYNSIPELSYDQVNGEWTCSENMTLLVVAQVRYSEVTAGANQIRGIMVGVGAAGENGGRSEYTHPDGKIQSISTSAIIELDANDADLNKFRIYTYQDSGANRNIDGPADCFVKIVRLA